MEAERRRRIIVGDVHGCVNELASLLVKVGFDRGSDDLILLGDLIDRGPDPVGVVAMAMRLEARICMGNHEEKALRWRRHEDRAAREPGYVNPLRGSAARPIPEERKAEWRALSIDQVVWLAKSPPWIELEDDWLAVHAGFEAKPLDDQRVDRVIRVRYVDPVTGEMVPYAEESLDQPIGSVPWQSAWTGPNVVYGHAVHSLKDPQIDESNGARVIGIDTGCCFGGRLTCMILDEPGAEPRFVQVHAEREYLPLPHGTQRSDPDNRQGAKTPR